jgi:hypothetical protein
MVYCTTSGKKDNPRTERTRQVKVSLKLQTAVTAVFKHLSQNVKKM